MARIEGVSLPTRIGNLCKKMNINSHKVMDIFFREREAELVALLPEAGVCVRRVLACRKTYGAPVIAAKDLDVELPIISQNRYPATDEIQQALDQVL